MDKPAAPSKAAYVDQPRSTWTDFAKATGIDLAAVCLVAKPAELIATQVDVPEVRRG